MVTLNDSNLEEKLNGPIQKVVGQLQSTIFNETKGTDRAFTWNQIVNFLNQKWN